MESIEEIGYVISNPNKQGNVYHFRFKGLNKESIIECFAYDLIMNRIVEGNKIKLKGEMKNHSNKIWKYCDVDCIEILSN